MLTLWLPNDVAVAEKNTVVVVTEQTPAAES